MKHFRPLIGSLALAAALGGLSLLTAGCAGAPAAPKPAAAPSEAPKMMSTVKPDQLEVARPGGKLPGDIKVQLVEVASGFLDPIHIASPHDGTGRLFVCERPGVIKIIKNGKVLDQPFYDNRANVAWQFLECGLYCVEFHPKFKENG